MEVHLGGELLEADWEIAVGHLPIQSGFDATVSLRAAVHADVVTRNEGGNEELKALDVIPMRVAEEEVGSDGQALVPQQAHRQRSDSRTGIEDDKSGLAIRTGLDGGRLERDAGGIAAVANGIRAGRWDGAPHAPKPDAHRCVLARCRHT